MTLYAMPPGTKLTKNMLRDKKDEADEVEAQAKEAAEMAEGAAVALADVFGVKIGDVVGRKSAKRMRQTTRKTQKVLGDDHGSLRKSRHPGAGGPMVHHEEQEFGSGTHGGRMSDDGRGRDEHFRSSDEERGNWDDSKLK